MAQELEQVLVKYRNTFHPVVPFDLNRESVILFDFTGHNRELDHLDLNNEEEFSGYVFGKMAESKAVAGVGGYNEERVIYKKSEVFSGEEPRSIHIGIDIWAKSGTEIYAPLAGRVHSYKNNDSSGDYGPTIVLKHELEGITFYTLYGHLSKTSLEGMKEGKPIVAGEQIATLGAFHENVHWPPHLHFQLIRDMENYYGDYPGVAPKSRRKEFLEKCPDPNLILNVKKL